MIEQLHPDYIANLLDWEKWRLVYESGDAYVEKYVRKFSRLEDEKDFRDRKMFTPTPNFAKGAVNEVKNAIFQRIADVKRVGGPVTYQKACIGEIGGVDRSGATMNWFLGHYVLPELLTMRKVGVYIDMPKIGGSVLSKGDKHPYLYIYTAESILNWDYDSQGQLVQLLLRDNIYERDEITGLPIALSHRYRYYHIDKGKVVVEFYNMDDEREGEPLVLGINEIPLQIIEITDSLLRDVANHQIALLNAESSDMNFIMKSNYPFYTEQVDDRANNQLIKAAQRAYRDEEGNIVTHEEEEAVKTGNTQGRRYGKGLDRPAFIAPPTDPLMASMQKQRALKEDIRVLTHLALSNIQSKMASAESKGFDNQGLEAGLSYIGLELANAEHGIGRIWAKYEGETEYPAINYPRRWSLKSEEERRAEVKELKEIREEVPSLIFKKEISKEIARAILTGKVSDERIEEIEKEIEEAKVVTCTPDVIIRDHEAGLISDETASLARGYSKGEVEQAKKDHAERLARIQAAQTPRSDPAARGVRDLSLDPQASSKEKRGKRKRGEGK